jgi:hypothetical protein
MKKRRNPYEIRSEAELFAALTGQRPTEHEQSPSKEDEMSSEQARQTAAAIRQRMEQQRKEDRARLFGPKSTSAPTPDRATGGRFARGNRGGPGNPFARQVAALRAALIQTVTEKDIKDIVTVLVRDAKRGNLAAIKLLFSYVIGKPAAAVDPDTLDVQEMDLLQRSAPPPPDTLETMRQQLPLSALLEQLHSDQANNEVQAKQATQHEQTPQAAPTIPAANGAEVAPPSQEATSSGEQCIEPAASTDAPSPNGGNGYQQTPAVDLPPALHGADSDQSADKRKNRPSPNGEKRARDPVVAAAADFPAAPPSSGGVSGT